MRDAPPLTLEAVDLILINTRRTHNLKLHAIPPASVARPLTIEAELTARDVDDIKTWSGVIEAEVAGVSFPHSGPLAAGAVSATSGLGSAAREL